MGITVYSNKYITPNNKSLLKASNNFRTPLKEPLLGCNGVDFKEGHKGACGTPPTPLLMNEDSTVNMIEHHKIKII